MLKRSEYCPDSISIFRPNTPKTSPGIAAHIPGPRVGYSIRICIPLAYPSWLELNI